MTTTQQKLSKWQTTASKTVYKNPWITVREDAIVRPDGSQGIYGVLEVKPSAFIVALNSDQKVLFVRQYRYPTQQLSWEIPAGGCENDEPLVAAKRELQEETGFAAGDWQAAGSFYPNNGLSTEKSFVFIAQELTETGKDKKIEDGIEKVASFSWSEIDSMLLSGELDDGQVISSLALARLFLQQK
jgi:8-oxo-dGTP pyrophosphatase MutT (NUDIX family)